MADSMRITNQLNQKFYMAESSWPRAGGDRANSSHVSISGPETGQIIKEIKFPKAQGTMNNRGHNDCVAADDETLRVISDGILFAVTIEGEILWSVILSMVTNINTGFNLSPVSLNSGACLVPFEGGLVIVDSLGSNISQINFNRHFLVEDTPNLTEDGDLIVTGSSGGVLLINQAGGKHLKIFGYDIPSVALYPDNSIAVAGYAQDGFCCVSPDGQRLWSTSLMDADLLPTINQDNIAAVGSLNDGISCFFSLKGEQLGTYERAAVFAEYSPDSWIARSKNYIAKITVGGQELWGFKLTDSEYQVDKRQPIVDGEGRIYVLDEHCLWCLSGEGEIILSMDLPGQNIGRLSCISPGKLALVCDGELKIIG